MWEFVAVRSKSTFFDKSREGYQIPLPSSATVQTRTNADEASNIRTRSGRSYRPPFLPSLGFVCTDLAHCCSFSLNCGKNVRKGNKYCINTSHRSTFTAQQLDSTPLDSRKEALLVLRALLHDVPQSSSRRLPAGLWTAPNQNRATEQQSGTTTFKDRTRKSQVLLILRL